MSEMEDARAMLIDEVKEEVGCLLSFLSAEDLRELRDTLKITGLTPEHHFTLLEAANIDRKWPEAIGQALMMLVTHEIRNEALELQGKSRQLRLVDDDGVGEVLPKFFGGPA